jgi:hypothetical protein
MIPEIVGKFIARRDFFKGLVRVCYDHCAHNYLLLFSCKGRWFLL